jgi:hypothetical protein
MSETDRVRSPHPTDGEISEEQISAGHKQTNRTKKKKTPTGKKGNASGSRAKEGGN